ALELMRDTREERRDPAKHVDRAADVVDEAGQGELCGTRPAARLVGRLEDRHREPGPGQRDGRGQPVWAGSDDDRVDVARIAHAWPPRPRPLTSPSPNGGMYSAANVRTHQRPVSRHSRQVE